MIYLPRSADFKIFAKESADLIILSTINGMFFPKQVMIIFNRSIGISISLKSRILSYYFQIQNFILKTLPDVKYEKSSHSIIYFNVNPCSHRFSRPIFISFLYNLHSPPTFLHSKLKGSNTNWIAKSKSSTGNIPVKRKLSQYLLHNTVIPYTSWSFLITSFNGIFSYTHCFQGKIKVENW